MFRGASVCCGVIRGCLDTCCSLVFVPCFLLLFLRAGCPTLSISLAFVGRWLPRARRPRSPCQRWPRRRSRVREGGQEGQGGEGREGGEGEGPPQGEGPCKGTAWCSLPGTSLQRSWDALFEPCPPTTPPPSRLAPLLGQGQEGEGRQVEARTHPRLLLNIFRGNASRQRCTLHRKCCQPPCWVTAPRPQCSCRASPTTTACGWTAWCTQ
jgi:hypothetical protein